MCPSSVPTKYVLGSCYTDISNSNKDTLHFYLTEVIIYENYTSTQCSALFKRSQSSKTCFISDMCFFNFALKVQG